MNWNILALWKGEECSCARKRPVVFCVLVAVYGWLAIQTNVWKVQNTTGRFLAQLHPSNFFPKILFLVPKVYNSRFFHENYLISDFHTNTVISRRVCLTRQNGVENREKAYCVSGCRKNRLVLNFSQCCEIRCTF